MAFFVTFRKIADTTGSPSRHLPTHTGLSRYMERQQRTRPLMSRPKLGRKKPAHSPPGYEKRKELRSPFLIPYTNSQKYIFTLAHMSSHTKPLLPFGTFLNYSCPECYQLVWAGGKFLKPLNVSSLNRNSHFGVQSLLASSEPWSTQVLSFFNGT